MNFSQIKCFLAAADCLSFTKAADRLFLSQPVLSRQIAAMEEELGMDLFVREKKSVRLTPAGEVFSEGLRRISADYRALLDRATAMAQGYAGSVSLGLAEGQRVCPPLSDVLQGVHTRYPDLRVKLRRHTLAGLKSALENGELDLAFMAKFDITKNEELDYITVSHEDAFLVIPKSHPLAGKEGLRLEDFKDSTFITLSEDESPRLARAPMLRNFKQLRADDIGTLALWLEAGYGIAPLSGKHQLRNNPNLVFVPMPELGQSEEILVWRRDNKNPAVPVIRDEFIRAVGEK